MPYITVSKKLGKTYFLHSKDVVMKGGRKQTIYYFASKIQGNAVNELPGGYKVIEIQRTGLPVLKKA